MRRMCSSILTSKRPRARSSRISALREATTSHPPHPSLSHPPSANPPLPPRYPTLSPRRLPLPLRPPHHRRPQIKHGSTTHSPSPSRPPSRNRSTHTSAPIIQLLFGSARPSCISCRARCRRSMSAGRAGTSSRTALGGSSACGRRTPPAGTQWQCKRRRRGVVEGAGVLQPQRQGRGVRGVSGDAGGEERGDQQE